MAPPTDKPTIENRLTLVELAVARMEGQVSNLVSEFGDLKEKVETMLCRLDDHQTALYGDKGKPGLVGQADTLEELRIALKGYGRDPGLIAEIKDLRERMERWDDGRKWLTRLVLGLIISDIVLQLVKFLHYFE